MSALLISTSALSQDRQEAGPAPERLRSAVLEAQSRLALSEPWQRKLFDNEVVPQYSRFIRDVRREGDAFVVDADVESIKRYLVFYAPRTLKREDLRLMAYARAESDCASCQDSLSEARRVIAARAESRGFKLQWISNEELAAEPPLSGAALEERVEQIAREGNAAAGLVVELRRSGSTGASARLHLLTRADSESEFSGQRETAEGSSPASAVSLLLADAFIDLGGREVMALAQAGDVADAPEVLIEVKGMTDFASFQRARDSLSEALAGIGVLEKRRITQGEVTFGVRTAKSVQEIQRTLASATGVRERLKLKEATADTVEAEILP